MKTIIQYTTFNLLKGGREQSYLKEVSNLPYYQELAANGTIWDFEILEF